MEVQRESLMMQWGKMRVGRKWRDYNERDTIVETTAQNGYPRTPAWSSKSRARRQLDVQKRMCVVTSSVGENATELRNY